MDIDMFKIKNGNIDYFEYSEFSNMKKVGSGSFGTVESADWKSYGIKIALKTFISNPSIDDEFIKEAIIILNIIFNLFKI